MCSENLHKYKIKETYSIYRYLLLSLNYLNSKKNTKNDYFLNINSLFFDKTSVNYCNFYFSKNNDIRKMHT